jgi:tetratricopeptide (TPR) repeat protein
MTGSIPAPDWRQVALHPGVLREPGPDDGRLVVWLPAEQDASYQYWQRIGSVPRAAITQHQGLSAIAATAIRARQLVRGRFGGLLRRFRRGLKEGDWLLPNGDTAEQCGERQTDLLLVWTENQSQPLDEARVRGYWPQSERVQSLGPHVCLLWGVATSSESGPAGQLHFRDNWASPSEPLPPEGLSLDQVERSLAAARRSGDRPAEASALTDLGLLALHRGDVLRAIARLEEALALARALGDRAREGDILGTLCQAVFEARQPEQARQHLEQALLLLRAAGDRFAEKLVLERLGNVLAAQGDLPAAITVLAEALALTRTLGDRQHEASLLWHLAIRHAEMGQREQALGYGQAAVHLLEKLGKPHARVYGEHLERYSRGEAEAGSRAVSDDTEVGAGVTTSLTGQTSGTSEPLPEGKGPGYLQMAISAAKALLQFVGSGMKTVTAETLHERLRGCAACSYRTGLRCRICGCFTELKARLPYEECPRGVWPAAPNSRASQGASGTRQLS